jgi:S1-C subfamily serine protease
MTLFDAILLGLVVLSVVGGYRRGAVLQVIALLGLGAGVVVGALLAPKVAALGRDPMSDVAMVMGTVIVCGAAGNLVGWLAGSRLREHTHGSRLRRVDAVGGSLVSVVALVLVTWFLALNLANGPFPQVARGIRDSAIIRELDAVMPPPPSLLGEAQRVLALLGFPDVFAGLPPAPADPVPPPRAGPARAAFRAAEGSTFEVLGDGCDAGYLNQGSGFVVRPGYLLTNAHVVAGTTRQWVHAGAADYQARVVAFDPAGDLALLHAPDLEAPSLPLRAGEVTRGAGGAVLGFPGGGPLRGDDAAVRQVLEPVGRDIYGRDEVTRRLYEIQAQVRHGNSGGPFVLPSGQVAGVVFASSVVEDGVGYAIASTDVRPFLQGAAGAEIPVGTGPCTG